MMHWDELRLRAVEESIKEDRCDDPCALIVLGLIAETRRLRQHLAEVANLATTAQEMPPVRGWGVLVHIDGLARAGLSGEPAFS
jgi:hypothetical protein